MHTEMMFLDCPAYTDRRGTTRCGLSGRARPRRHLAVVKAADHAGARPYGMV